MNGNGQFVIQHSVDKSGNPVFIRGVGMPNGDEEGHARSALHTSRGLVATPAHEPLSLAPRCIHDNRHADETNGGSDDVELVRASTV